MKKVTNSLTGKKPSAKPTQFRLKPEVKSVLEERLSGLKPNDLARHYVVESLLATEERSALHETQKAFRTDLALIA